MLTTIFTGHTLNLADIVAVSPIMRETKGTLGSIYQRILYLELHLKYGAVVRYDELRQQIVIEPQREEADQWQSSNQQLDEQRTELIQAWSQATATPIEEEVTG